MDDPNFSIQRQYRESLLIDKLRKFVKLSKSRFENDECLFFEDLHAKSPILLLKLNMEDFNGNFQCFRNKSDLYLKVDNYKTMKVKNYNLQLDKNNLYRLLCITNENTKIIPIQIENSLIIE